MGPWARVRRALGATFLVYVATGIFAALTGLPLAVEAERWLGGLPASGPLRAELIVHLAKSAPPQLVSTGLALLVLALLAPWLQMAWLSALHDASSLGDALRRGAERYLRAVLVSLCTAFLFGFLAGALGALVWGTHSLLDGRVDTRLHDLATLGAAATLLPAIALGATWHDLARAHGLAHSPIRSTLWGLRTALRPAAWGHWLLWTAAGLIVVVGADQLGERAGSALMLAPAVAAVQLGALARTVLRSRWLATAVALSQSAPAGMPGQSDTTPMTPVMQGSEDYLDGSEL